MKIHTNDTQAETFGVISQNSFSIKATPKMLKILSSGIYSNKVLAIVRELCANAIDAHRAGGRSDVPFFVHLPTTIEPWFAVRDTGIGLSDRDAMILYTTYGESTKDNSDLDVGGFGVGSKTPFCYTSSFTVISVHGGMRRVYSAFSDNTGFNMVKLHEEATTDHVGLEVRVPVNAADFQKFRDTLVQVAEYFTLRPDCNIPGIYVYDRGETAYETEKFRFYKKKNSYYGSERATAVIGPIGYPINFESVQIDYDEANLLRNFGLDMFYGIDELDVAVSRETLSYEQRTIDRLKSDLQTAIKELKANFVSNMFPQTMSYWDMCVKTGPLKPAIAVLGVTVKHNDVGLIAHSRVQFGTFHKIATETCGAVKFSMSSVVRRRNTVKCVMMDHDSLIDANEEIKFYVADLPSTVSVHSRVKYNDDGTGNSYIIYAEPSVVDALFDKIGYTGGYTLVSTLPQKPRAPRGSRSSGNGDFYDYEHGSFVRNGTKAADITEPEETVWVEMHYGNPIDVHDINRVMSYLEGYSLIGVNPSKKDKIPDGVRYVKDVFREYVTAVVEKTKSQAGWQLNQFITENIGGEMLNILKVMAANNLFDLYPEMSEFSAQWKDAEKVEKMEYRLVRLAEYNNIDCSLHSDISGYENAIESLRKKKPMLKGYNSSIITDVELIDYLKEV